MRFRRLDFTPRSETIAKPNCGYDDAMENIDIGGPAMLRAAAKNHERVAVVIEPRDSALFSTALKVGGTTLQQRRQVAEYLGARAADPETPEAFAPMLHLSLHRGDRL